MSKKVIILIGAVFLFLLVVLLVAGRIFLTQVKPVSLTVYGLWEDPQVFSGVIDDYVRLHPNVKIKYEKQSPINYRDRITNALQKPDGPDIVRIHATWLPMLQSVLAPIPQSSYAPADYLANFYPAHIADLTLNGQIYAVPLEIDGLVLFVNQDLLDQAGLLPVSTWEEFQDQVQRLTVKDRDGRIQTAGVALGATSNVDHWQEIVSLMMYQNSANIISPVGEPASGALSNYTDYITKLGVWDETLDNSTVAFAHGKVAYYFGPTWRYFDIKELAKGTNLNFKIIPVPQISGATPVYVSTYWAEAVSAQSPNKEAAIEFLKYLSSKDVMTKLYAEETKQRQFGEPYPRKDLQGTLSTDQNVGPFIKNADKAKSSYLASFTWDGDSGINSRVSKYYEDAINSILKGGNPADSLETLTSGMSQISSVYKLSAVSK